MGMVVEWRKKRWNVLDESKIEYVDSKKTISVEKMEGYRKVFEYDKLDDRAYCCRALCLAQ
jgi:hypothetical protein